MTIVTPHSPPVDIGITAVSAGEPPSALSRIAERRVTDPAVSSAVTVGPFVGVNLHQPPDGPTSVVLAVAGGARNLCPAEAIRVGWALLNLGYAVDVAEDGDS